MKILLGFLLLALFSCGPLPPRPYDPVREAIRNDPYLWVEEIAKPGSVAKRLEQDQALRLGRLQEADIRAKMANPGSGDVSEELRVLKEYWERRVESYERKERERKEEEFRHRVLDEMNRRRLGTDCYSYIYGNRVQTHCY